MTCRIFCVLACVLVLAASASAQTPQENEAWVRAFENKVERLEQGIQTWQRDGRDLSPVAPLMERIPPLMERLDHEAAERLIDEALKRLQTPAPPRQIDWQAIEPFRRQTHETQYLVFPISEVNGLYAGRTQWLADALERVKERVGPVQNPRRRNVAFHFMFQAWRLDSKHPINPHMPHDYLARAIGRAFDVALQTDIAVYFTVENLEWAHRPDLWNYRDPDASGFDPKNTQNVEWMDWEGTPHPHRYRDWGRPEQMPPVMCYNSPQVLAEVARLTREEIAPPIAEGLERLQAAGKTHLFAGITVGAEPALPNYEGIEEFNPRMAEAMRNEGVPRTRLGFNALTNLGFSESNPPPDFAAALARVNQEYAELWARHLHEGSIPREKMYTHVAAGAGVIGSPGVRYTNAPISIAFVEHARPGWTTYPVGPLQDNFKNLYQQLAEHGEAHWASTEASPSGLGPAGLSMGDYLRWHFDYGATVVVFNTGATSPELSERLRSAVWGKPAINAYRMFLSSAAVLSD